jgi:hypothetical protein
MRVSLAALLVVLATYSNWLSGFLLVALFDLLVVLAALLVVWSHYWWF